MKGASMTFSRFLNIARLSVLLFAGAHAAPADSPLGRNGRLRVCGLQLCNESGSPIQLRGVSLSGIQWFHGNFYKDGKALAAMATWGADITRIPVYSDTLLPLACDPHNADGYRASRFLKEFPDSKTGFKTLVDRYVEQAESLGMYAVIDWHLHFPGNPNRLLETASEFFEYMSKKHGHRKNVLYEIANEPSRHSGSCPNARNPAPDCFWKDCIKPYSRKITEVIRKNDPDGIIIAGTTCWSSFGLKCVNNPAVGAPAGDGPRYPGELAEIQDNPMEDANTMYTVHIYSGDGKWKAERIEEMASRLPVFLTEWAAQNSAAFADSAKADHAWPEARRIIDIAAKRKISWIYWNLSPGKYMAVFKEKTASTANLSPTGGNTTLEGDSVHAWMTKPADDFPSGPQTKVRAGRAKATGSFHVDGLGHLIFGKGMEPVGAIRIFSATGRRMPISPLRVSAYGTPHAISLGRLPPGGYLIQYWDGRESIVGAIEKQR
jgi:endoglucanase